MANDEESKDWRDYRGGFREMVDVYGWVWKTLLGNISRRAIFWLLILVLIGNAWGMATPWFLGKMANAAKSPQTAVSPWIWFAGLVLTYVIREYMRYKEGSLREIVIMDAVGEVDRQTTRIYLEKSLGQILSEANGLSSSNLEKGRGRVHEILGFVMFENLGVPFLVIGSWITLCLMSPLAGGVMGFVGLLYLLWSRHLNNRVAQTCLPIDEQFSALNRYRMQRIERSEPVKANGKELEEVNTIHTWFQRTLKLDRDFWLWYIRQNSYRGLWCLAGALGITAYGLSKVMYGDWDLAQLFTVASWSMVITDNIWRLGHIQHRLGWHLPAIRTLKIALETPADVIDKTDAITIGPGPIRLEVCNLSHTYGKEGEQKPTLKDVSFTIEPGERVALIGRSGAGKSTIMRLCQRGMDPTGGHIRVNGYDLRDIQLASWLSIVGYIPQTSAVFDGTIRENLLYGLTPDTRAQITDDEAWEIVDKLGLRPRLIKGLDTRVGRNGIKLSGGEQQRSTIGTALAKNPSFMLIDEATSHLDSTTEKEVQRGLEEALLTGVSALVIAHRLSTIRHCDKFVLIEDGRIEAIATSFEELYAASPVFRQLADDQEVKIGPTDRSNTPTQNALSC